MQHDGVTLQSARYRQTYNAMEGQPEAPPGPRVWHSCPSRTLGRNGLPTYVSDVRGALAIHDAEASTRAFLSDPVTPYPRFHGAVERWDALAIPVAHRGGRQKGEPCPGRQHDDLWFRAKDRPARYCDHCWLRGQSDRQP